MWTNHSQDTIHKVKEYTTLDAHIEHLIHLRDELAKNGHTNVPLFHHDDEFTGFYEMEAKITVLQGADDTHFTMNYPRGEELSKPMEGTVGVSMQ